MSSTENTPPPATPEPATTAKTAKKSSKRGPGFNLEEDKQLCSSFLEKSIDPIVGTDRKLVTYWNQVTEHFNEERKVAVDKANVHLKKKEKFTSRTSKSLVGRWTLITPKINKFCTYYEKEVRIIPSGNNPDYAVSLY